MISKIICFLLLLIVPIINISANSEEVEDELENITNDVEIRYKWYKEEIVGDYYPANSDNSGYLVDWSKVKYGEYSAWSKDNCDIVSDYYNVESKESYDYSKVPGVRYIKITNFRYDDNVFVYFKNVLVSHSVVTNSSNYAILDLKKFHKPDDLTIYIQDATGYTIYLGRFKAMNSYYLHKENTTENEIMIPDASWIDDSTYFEEYITTEYLRDTDLTKKIETFKSCRYRELYVYKYKIERKYYDNNYYVNVDGYIKDVNDYQIFYKNEVINNTVTVYEDKIVEKPVKEYVYVDTDNNQSNDNAEIIVENNEATYNEDIVEGNDVDTDENLDDNVDVNENNDKEIIYKIPRWIYLVMILNIILVIFLVIKICRLKYLASIVEVK